MPIQSFLKEKYDYTRTYNTIRLKYISSWIFLEFYYFHLNLRTFDFEFINLDSMSFDFWLDSWPISSTRSRKIYLSLDIIGVRVKKKIHLRLHNASWRLHLLFRILL